MPDDNDSLRDANGVIYERNWAGQYEKKWDMLSQDYARDRTDLEYQPNAYGEDGTPLYKPQRQQPVKPASSTSSGGEAILYLLVLIAALALGLIVIVIGTTPISAPILLTMVDDARKKGNVAQVKKLQIWSELASGIAILVVFALSMMMGLGVFSWVMTLAQNNTSTLFTGFIFILASNLAFISGMIVFVIGIAPTAIVFLRQSEARANAAGDPKRARRIRLLYRIIGGAAAVSVIFVLAATACAIVLIIGWFLLGS